MRKIVLSFTVYRPVRQQDFFLLRCHFQQPLLCDSVNHILKYKAILHKVTTALESGKAYVASDP